MTSEVDIGNRALQAIGNRSTIASLSENSNEAIQLNLVLTKTRDELIRMAPWNCATNYANLVFVTSAPGTPQNATSTLTAWAKGIPAPPWFYEYQYPADCMRPLFVVPQWSSGFQSGVPIFPTGIGQQAPNFWNGPPARFKVGIDQFWSATAAAIVSGGTGHAIGDVVTLAVPSSGLGAPAKVLVTNVAAGVITAATLVSVTNGGTLGGSYFTKPTGTQAQSASTGSGIGASFTLTFGTAQVDQRVILTNQETAILSYLRQVTDPNVMDPMFVEAWIEILAARVAYQLTGDTATANLKINLANAYVTQARTADGNEGLTINDVTPDWIRVRGYIPVGAYGGQSSPYAGFDWGPLFSVY